jgi:putative ABC transport system ATP-binding protein
MKANSSGKKEIKNGSPVILVRNLTKSFETPAGGFRALVNIDLEIGSGEFVAVIGKSGSGKSTLLNVIAGIDRPSQGSIVVNGCVLDGMRENKISSWRGRNIGVIFQFFQLLPCLTILENIILPMDFCNTYPLRERRKRGLELLDEVGIAAQAGKLPAALSGGEQQRAAIARALANDPPVIAADEPTGNLDTHTTGEILALFRRLNAAGKTIVMVTHEQDIAANVSRIVSLADGRIVHDKKNNR